MQRVIDRGTLFGLRLPFYGWAITAVGFVVTFCSGAGQTYVFAVFIDPIIRDTGLSRTTISSLFTVGTLVSALAVIAISRLVDRVGARLMLILLAIGTGAACLWMSRAAGLAALALGFTALRVLGQGALPTTSTLLLNQWFVRWRGRAVALASLGIALSSGILPPAIRWLIERLGWRDAYLTLGIMVAVAIVPLVLVLVRDHPEAFGLVPDGVARPQAAEPRPTTSRPSLGLAEVLGSSKFWLLAAPIGGSSFCVNALIFHQISIFTARGLSETVAAAAFVPSALAAAAGMLLVGFGVDRGGIRIMSSVCVGLLLVGLVAAQTMASTPVAFLYATLVGISGGMLPVLSGVTWAHYYGRRGLGRIQGPAMMVHIGSAALGPLPVAALQQWQGSYLPAYGMMAAILAIGLVAAVGYRPAERLAAGD